MRTLSVVLVAACSYTHVPPPAAPPPVTPQPTVMLGDPPPGASHVLIDSDGPAKVEEVTARVETIHGDAPELRIVCTATPCDAHLAQGPHVLQFSHPDGSWAGTADVDVGTQPTALRYALGHRTSASASHVGSLVAILGFTFAIGGLAGSTRDGARGETGRDVAVGGLVAGLIGVAIAVSGTPEQQDGAATEWSLAR
jgi:hypothetical protein